MTSLSDQHLIYKARYERLTEIGRQLNTTFDLDTLLHQIIEDVTELLHAEAAAILLADPDSGELSFAVASPISDPHGKLPGISVPIDRSIAGWVTTNGRPQVVNDVKSDPRWFPEVALVSDFETRNLVSVPLRVQDSIIGAVNTINKHDHQLWTDDDVEILTDFADQAAIAIRNAQLYQTALERQKLENELSIAKEIQLSLLPDSVPEIEGWEFAAVYISARQIGGDFYDFLELKCGDDQTRPLGIVVADVSDKGVPAALYMAVSRTFVRTAAMTVCTPVETLLQANSHMVRDTHSTNQFVTAIYAVLNPLTGQMDYALAGHNPPLWWRNNSKEVKQLAGRGIILGVFDDIRLEELSIVISPGDVLLFYTDGMCDAMNSDGEDFGMNRLENLLKTHARKSAEEIAQAVVVAVNEFVGDAQQFDDVTLVICKREK